MNPAVRPTDAHPISRRTMITGVGVATAAVAGLTSCSNYSAPTEGGGGGASGGGSSSAITAKTADIPVGGGKIFVDKELNQHAVITQPTAGEFKAFSSICPHAQCDVSEVTTTINCRSCHQSEFSITDGAVVKPPANAPLTPKTIKVDGDSITVT